ncbi:MAG TPA: acyl-CoA dehydrogenase [Burkholderiaceae bacterium]|nr:acyl-CoA dehydrogenase [Burkholderiaceae bacterium]
MPADLIDRRLLSFLLYDWLQAERLTAYGRFSEHSRATFDAALDAAGLLAANEFAPLNRELDENEPQFDGERVLILDRLRGALEAFAKSGFLAAAQDAELGGMQLPVVIEKACLAFFKMANIAASAYPFLTIGNANLLLAHGTPKQIEVFAQPELAGRFFGTMCLSEPQAGSSLGDIRTRATPDGAGFEACALGPRYRLFGNKMWISGGEHELSENIVHLVLAKIADGEGVLPAGVKGISIFIVPRRLVGENGSVGERNDVVLAGLNHKMGYRGTVNTLLNFGEGRFRPDGSPGAVGYRVGAAGQGLAIMFHMMNEARIGVGLGATMLGYAGYRYSLEYARERPQGRPIGPDGKDPTQPQVPIIRHADIRRMLLAQKAYTEGALALNLYCARLVDVQHHAPDGTERAEASLLLEMLTPIAKSWPSEWCLEANNLAIQILGGYGYTRDYPVEQYWRDNRLNMIHEGTHGIQALDLLGRKVVMREGAGFSLVAGRITATIDAASRAAHPDTRRFATQLQAALEHVGRVTRVVWAHGDPRGALAHATPYMQAFGHVVLAWTWLELSLAASRAYRPQDDAFLHGIWAACRYFFVYELGRVAAWLAPAESGDRTVQDLQEVWL